MSTTRIDGWVRHDADEIMREGAAVTFKPGAKLYTADITATLVIGGKCFTEDEVKAIMREVTHCTGSPVSSIHIDEVRRIFSSHGIQLP